MTIWNSPEYLKKYEQEFLVKLVIIGVFKKCVAIGNLKSYLSNRFQKSGTNHKSQFFCDALYFSDFFEEVTDSHSLIFSVLDIGGGGGDNLAMLIEKKNLEWTIVDDEVFTRIPRLNPYTKLIKRISSSEISNNFDVVFVRGALQYLSEELIAKLVQLKIRYFVISRTVLTDQKQLVKQQINLGRDSYLINNQVYSEKELISFFKERNYILFSKSHSHDCLLNLDNGLLSGHYKIMIFQHAYF